MRLKRQFATYSITKRQFERHMRLKRQFATYSITKSRGVGDVGVALGALRLTDIYHSYLSMLVS